MSDNKTDLAKKTLINSAKAFKMVAAVQLGKKIELADGLSTVDTLFEQNNHSEFAKKENGKNVLNSLYQELLGSQSYSV